MKKMINLAFLVLLLVGASAVVRAGDVCENFGDATGFPQETYYSDAYGTHYCYGADDNSNFNYFTDGAWPGMPIFSDDNEFVCSVLEFDDYMFYYDDSTGQNFLGAFLVLQVTDDLAHFYNIWTSVWTYAGN